MILQPIFLTLKVAALATLVTLILGTVCAYIMVRKNIRGKNIWETILILPMVLPPSILGYILLILLGRRGPVGGFLLEHFNLQIIFTWVACVIASSIVSLPLMYQSIKTGLLGVDSIYEDAARDLGANRWQVFWKVTFPLAMPGLISGIVLSFARSMGEFGATLMVAGNIPGKTQTISTAIYFAVDGGKDYLANMLVLIMTLLSFILVFGLNFWIKKEIYK
ncbi:molybdate ABC transporter permease subunit [Aminipila terrae]|uniref:Molybdenum transport system permease n=1 Tax=Aminipila terrae TaxID=2697030 RepID=A0A6P1ML49_9FIRM|nr:molybdate ABC transporter permease subunit [Aminipila terrae]QHI72376.1 molybdate ABC transporter permease subunit [Aminipila terrae]